MQWNYVQLTSRTFLQNLPTADRDGKEGGSLQGGRTLHLSYPR